MLYKLVRIAASVQSGQCTAAQALSRFGVAARGQPVYKAGMHLRRLFRTIFLIDYFTNAAFRHEMQHVLNRDEAVHILQRASDPDIKGVVQEQVGQQRAHYAAYNVAYFSLRRLNHSNFRCQKPQAVGQP